MIVRRAKLPEIVAAFYRHDPNAKGIEKLVFVAIDLGRWHEQVAVRMALEKAKVKRGPYLYGVVMRKALPPKPYLVVSR